MSLICEPIFHDQSVEVIARAEHNRVKVRGPTDELVRWPPPRGRPEPTSFAFNNPMYKRQPLGGKLQITLIEPQRLVLTQTNVDFHARRAKLIDALPVDSPIRILDRNYRAGDAGFDQRVGARGRSPMV